MKLEKRAWVCRRGSVQFQRNLRAVRWAAAGGSAGHGDIVIAFRRASGGRDRQLRRTGAPTDNVDWVWAKGDCPIRSGDIVIAFRRASGGRDRQLRRKDW